MDQIDGATAPAGGDTEHLRVDWDENRVNWNRFTGEPDRELHAPLAGAGTAHHQFEAAAAWNPGTPRRPPAQGPAQPRHRRRGLNG